VQITGGTLQSRQWTVSVAGGYGLVGSVAGLAAAGRMKVRPRPVPRETPEGLAAFEQAPCYAELVEREARGERQS
jgi:hypothetical protein